MAAITILLLVCVAAYFLFRHTTKRGANTVRAYIYLSAIKESASVQEANRLAKVDAAYLSTLLIRDAQEHVRSVYGGKQLLMIAEAGRLGLVLRG